jgi:hypothetical protein
MGAKWEDKRRLIKPTSATTKKSLHNHRGSETQEMTLRAKDGTKKKGKRQHYAYLALDPATVAQSTSSLRLSKGNKSSAAPQRES